MTRYTNTAVLNALRILISCCLGLQYSEILEKRLVYFLKYMYIALRSSHEVTWKKASELSFENEHTFTKILIVTVRKNNGNF